MGYSKEEQESTNTREPYVVYDRRDPSLFVTGTAVTWDKAKELGAEKLGIKSEHAWAVLLLEGDTPKQAVARNVAMLSRRGNDGGKK